MEFAQYEESARFIQSRLEGFAPEVLVVLGSGLGFLADDVRNAVRIDYREIPHFRVSTALGHKGCLAAGRLAGRNVLLMQGRLHVYEGYTAEEAAYPVRVAKLLGVHSVLLTNAAGGINLEYRVGEFMAISDFIRLPWANALIGPNLEAFGPRFPDMSRVFSPEYRAILRRVAKQEQIPLHEGVYYYCTGPNYETPAEIRAFRTLGADAVGMSTVHEAMAAAHAGMRVLGVSLIANMAAGVLDGPLSGDEVIKAGEQAKEPFSRLILGFLEAMP